MVATVSSVFQSGCGLAKSGHVTATMAGSFVILPPWRQSSRALPDEKWGSKGARSRKVCKKCHEPMQGQADQFLMGGSESSSHCDL